MVYPEELYHSTLKDIEQLKRIQITDYLQTLKVLNDLRKEQQVVLDSVTRKVFFETDEHGKKKKYTNDTIRKVEINRRLAESEEYRQREKDIENLEEEVLKNKVEQEYLRKKIALNKEYLASSKKKTT